MAADSLYIKAINETDYHDACGVGFIVESSGKSSKRVIDLAINALSRMSHRGAAGADELTGDGVGIMVEIPERYFLRVLREHDKPEPKEGNSLGIAMVFVYGNELNFLGSLFSKYASSFDVNFITLRSVPVNHDALGELGRKTCPGIFQFFFEGRDNNSYDFETRLYIIRKAVEKELLDNGKTSYICSMSSKTIVYKGLMKFNQLSRFYHDLTSEDFISRYCVFHERFSTNTISTWEMAQPFRMTSHNGEINTIKGNRLWMQTREKTVSSKYWKENLELLKPIVSLTGSDSYSLDNVLEFLSLSKKNLLESIMMLIPEPYNEENQMNEELRNFYIYHENFIEPWDGPAALVFSDGNYLCARLDRNGLRPLRYSITKDGLIIMASEAGVVDIAADNIELHHHMKAGEIFAFDLTTNFIMNKEQIIENVVKNKNYTSQIHNNLRTITRENSQQQFSEFALPEGGFDKRLRVIFGVDKEDLDRFIIPMSAKGSESIGSMGDDTPPAVISKVERRLYDYFKQSFAQVTNPPIDPIRERYVMSLYRYIGSEGDLLSESDMFGGALRIESPVLSPREVNQLKENHNWFPHEVVYCHCAPEEDLENALNRISEQCSRAVEYGSKILFISDEGAGENALPIPMLLVVSAVHQFLVGRQLRNKCSLLCFTGAAIEDHHIACLIGFGATAVYPYMAYELIREHFQDEDWISRMSNYRYALEKGLLKIMAKMGISTVTSYHGSMLFHGIGLSQEFLNKYFPSVKSSLGGLDLKIIKQTMLNRGKRAVLESRGLEEIGKFRFRKDGEAHGFSPGVFKRIHNISTGKAVKEEAHEVPVYLRDLLDFKTKKTVPLESVEPAEEILRRFGLGAISFGAVSEEVHRTLARAAHILKIRSNTGEGGEQKDRYSITNPDKSENCYVKQIASGRFGVTSSYLSAAREIQIKMAQGAKPGEGGQLPGEKVTISIANDRNTTPGVPLISPPPHHDIYSIEDIAQLIYDLRQVNPRAKICVKLVSQYGIGIVASGVVKAGADIVLVSGNDGGTGASPLGSIKHTGLPWELGLSEVHKTLVENGLRDRVTLRVDGGLKEGRDVIIASLLGAEEYDFGTSALVALGCVMARQCHLNTCPAGIATQDVELRKRFSTDPDRLIRFIKNVAEEVRNLLSGLGYFSLSEIVGAAELLCSNTLFEEYIREKNIDLSYLLSGSQTKLTHLNLGVKYKISEAKDAPHIDESVIEEVRPAIMTHGRVIVDRKIKNTDRAAGTRLAGLLSFLYGQGSFKGHIQYRLDGAAGQSLGAFLVDNVEIRHCGVANDFVGKGMSGGLISLRFPREIRKSLEHNTIIGNVALYGATGGELFCAGRAGERFAVRNSGAAAVVEGVGNHCCEYMTRGIVIVLGEIGINFGAGMTGGNAFIYHDRKEVERNINREYVRIDKISEVDEGLILKSLVNHKFHTGSTVAASITENWDIEKYKFVKIVPLALDIIDFKKIYEEQYLNRKLNVFNE